LAEWQLNLNDRTKPVALPTTTHYVWHALLRTINDYVIIWVKCNSSRTIMKVLSLTLLFVGAVFVAYLVRRELVWIGTAFFLAVALNPAVDWIQRFMPKNHRGSAVGVVFVMLSLFFGLVVASMAPPLVVQTEQLSRNLPSYTDQLVNGHSWLSDQVRSLNLVDKIRQSQDQVLTYASTAGGSFFEVLQGFFSGFAAILTVLGLTFFMLLEGKVWVEAFWKLVSPVRRTHLRLLAGEMYDAVTGYVTGNMLTSLLATGSTTIVLVSVGVPYAIPLGILVGLFDLLPLVGATIGAALVTGISLFASVKAAVVVALFFVIYQQLENHILQPVVYGRTVKMSPLTVLRCSGGGGWAVLGALVAIPLGASVQVWHGMLHDLRILRVSDGISGRASVRALDAGTAPTRTVGGVANFEVVFLSLVRSLSASGQFCQIGGRPRARRWLRLLGSDIGPTG
jgi:predicted PurR-regulated permease PerM